MVFDELATLLSPSTESMTSLPLSLDSLLLLLDSGSPSRSGSCWEELRVCLRPSLAIA